MDSFDIVYQIVDIDIDKITYNNSYIRFNHFSKRYPYYYSIPGFEDVIQNIVHQNKDNSPLKEINERLQLKRGEYECKQQEPCGFSEEKNEQ